MISAGSGNVFVGELWTDDLVSNNALDCRFYGLLGQSYAAPPLGGE